MRTFGLPFRLHELGGQPIEQFWMRRPFALRAQVVQHFRNARAEELTPKAIHIDARGQRILRRCQPVRQVQPCGAPPAGFEFAEKGRDGGLHKLAGIVHPVSTRQYTHLRGCGSFRDHHTRYGFIESRGCQLELRNLYGFGFGLSGCPFEMAGDRLFIVIRALVFRGT